VDGVVSGLLRSKDEGREPRTSQFSNQIDATDFRSHERLTPRALQNTRVAYSAVFMNAPVRVPNTDTLSRWT
jgi:hypothetical protein